MAAQIVKCLKEHINLDYEGDPKLQVDLVPSRNMQLESDSKNVYISFPGVYEGCIMQPLVPMLLNKIPFTCSLQQLIEIRKGQIETYYKVTDNLYQSSMYLFEFQKQIINAGHWDAYNYFLFMDSFPQEFEEWYTTNKDSFNAFVDWYNQAPFTLGDGRSVDPMQIYRSYNAVDLMKAIFIQAKLTSDPITDDTED